MPDNSNIAVIFPGRDAPFRQNQNPPLSLTGDNQTPFFQVNIGGAGVAGVFTQVPARADDASNQIEIAHVETSLGGFSPPLKVFGNPENWQAFGGGPSGDLPLPVAEIQATQAVFQRVDIGERAAMDKARKKWNQKRNVIGRIFGF